MDERIECLKPVAFVFFALLAISNIEPVHAGASNALMTCNGSGKNAGLQIVADIPGDFAEYNVKLEYQSAQKVWSDSDNPMIVSVHDFERKVFVVGVGEEFVLYADPKTIHFVAKEPNRELHASFSAFVSAPKPGTTQWSAGGYLDHVRVTCKYDFSS